MNEKTPGENNVFRVSFAGFICNILLTIIKFIAGICANSVSMLSDAAHSAADIVSSVMVIIGVGLTKKSTMSKEKAHKIEVSILIFLSVFIFITGIGIGFEGIKKIITGEYKNAEVPGIEALVVAAVSIAAKEFLYLYTKFCAKKYGSEILKADAVHHCSDVYSSAGSFIGISAAMLGQLIFEPLASITISAFIIKLSLDIFNDITEKIKGKKENSPGLKDRLK